MCHLQQVVGSLLEFEDINCLWNRNCSTFNRDVRKNKDIDQVRAEAALQRAVNRLTTAGFAKK